MTGDPPLLAGDAHVKFTSVMPGIADKDRGEVGADSIMALDSVDRVLSPARFTAETWK